MRDLELMPSEVRDIAWTTYYDLRRTVRVRRDGSLDVDFQSSGVKAGTQMDAQGMLFFTC